MKSILIKVKYKHGNKDTAYALVQHCIKAGLWEAYHQDRLNALAKLLESNSNNIRNNEAAAHGQGIEIHNVDQHDVSYVLHMAAATILFLCQCYEAKIQKKK